jgi:hypothetical protein
MRSALMAPAAVNTAARMRVKARSVMARLRCIGVSQRGQLLYAVATDDAASSRVSGVLPQRVVWAYSINRGK